MIWERLRSKRNQRGAVLVEAAIVTPVVLLLIFAIAWGALLFRSYLTVENAAKVGDRAASIAGDDADADWQVLQAIRPNVAALGSDASVQQIIVYRADGFEQGPPASCLAGTASARCNIYTGADLSRGQDQFGPGGQPIDDNYAPSSREVSRSNPGYIGVYVQAKPGVAAFGLPVPESVSSYKVLRLEARRY
jgi:hypothetical protein